MRFLFRFTPAVILMTGALLLSACKSAEERAEEHFQSALELLAEGDKDRAIVQLRNVFDMDSGHLEARRTMAEVQLEKGNLRGAYRQYLFVAEKFPDDLESRIVLVELAFANNNWEEVDRHGARAQELAPEDPRVQVIALVRDYRNTLSDAVSASRGALAARADAMLSEQPDSVLLRNVMIDYSIRQQDFTRALTEIDWMIEREPQSTRYYQDRLRVLSNLGDTAAVEAQLREMIRLFPDDLTHQQTLIRFYISQQNLDGAEGFLRELAEASSADDPVPTVELISFLSEFRDAEVVETEIAKAIAERSDPIPFEVLGANLEFTTGKADDAIARLQRVVDSEATSEHLSGAKITLAKMQLAAGNEVGARALVETVLAEDATQPDALKMQAAWQIEADDTDAALRSLRTVLDHAQQDAQAMTLMASAYARSGQPELSKDFLAQAVEASGNAPRETLRYAQVLISEERYLPAEDLLLASLRVDTSNINILVTLGQLYLRMEDFGRASSVVNALRRIGGDTALQAANGIEAGRIQQQRGVRDAVSFIEDLAEGADSDLTTKIAVVRARLSTGDSAGALLSAEQLKADNPDNDVVDAVLATAQIANGQMDAAEALYTGLLETNPRRPNVWRALSRLQMLQGDRDAAKALIDDGLEHLPTDANLLWAKASFMEQDGDIDGAIEVYEQLYEMDSNSVVVANNLASLITTYRSDPESLDRAWTIARRLREATSPALKDTYGWILHRRGNSAEALNYLKDAAEGLPGDPIVQYHLGKVFVALERPDDALEQIRKALELAGPTDSRPQIEDARALAQSLQNAEAASDTEAGSE